MPGDPIAVKINAWTGDASPHGELQNLAWGLHNKLGISESDLDLLRPAEAPDENDWKNPSIGWGLVLPDRPDLSAEQRATGSDAPAPIRDLLATRGNAPVFRWSNDVGEGHLRRYFTDRPPSDLSIAAGRRGIADNAIPKYLLIYATPGEIPWRTQYMLNMTAYVGRLALREGPLRTYVDHLIDEWSGASSNPKKPVVWTVDHRLTDDITTLMRKVLADPLWKKFAGDTDLSGVMIDGPKGTCKELVDALRTYQPGLVVTTSHGATGPLADPAKLKADLGLLVDVEHARLSAQDVLAAWEPDGAIWYAHACCSAGSDAPSRYETLFADGSDMRALLRSVSDAASASIAPLPIALLSAAKPLRAWIGHVEPTFDFTLRDPDTREKLAVALVSGLYDRLYTRGMTVGNALSAVYREAGQFMGLWREALNKINKGDLSAKRAALYCELVAMDRQAMVILGDPTVKLADF